jgi:hypothetical protein
MRILALVVIILGVTLAGVGRGLANHLDSISIPFLFFFIGLFTMFIGAAYLFPDEPKRKRRLRKRKLKIGDYGGCINSPR